MKTKLIILFIGLAFTQHAFSQCDSITIKNVINYTPFVVDKIVEADGLRNGPDYNDATLFFPTNSTGQLKSLVLVPGYRATQSSVTKWAQYLAARGFVCMTIGTNSLYDTPDLRAKALIDAMETIRQENKRANSPLYQKIDTGNIAVGGWSMGGGGAQLAAKLDTRIKAVFAIAPWLYPSTLAASDLNHNSPVLIISGQNDPTAPPASHANMHYNYTPNTTKKMLIEISGGNHSTPLDPTLKNGDVGNVAYAWLKMVLEGNNCYCGFLSTSALDLNSTSSFYQTNINCAPIKTNKQKIQN